MLFQTLSLSNTQLMLSLFLKVLALLSNANDDMVREILAFLDVLLESGNTDVREGLKEILKCKEHPMFATFERVLKEDAVAYSER